MEDDLFRVLVGESFFDDCPKDRFHIPAWSMDVRGKAVKDVGSGRRNLPFMV